MKFPKVINPPIFILLLIFLVVNILDAVTAMFILPGEANPIYLLTGSIWSVFALKLLVVGGFFYFWYRGVFPSNFQYYIYVTVLVFGILLICFGVTSNIYGMKNSDALDAAKDMTKGEKTKAYTQIIVWLYFIPVALLLFIFKMYECSLKYITIKKEPMFKKNQ